MKKNLYLSKPSTIQAGKRQFEYDLGQYEQRTGNDWRTNQAQYDSRYDQDDDFSLWDVAKLPLTAITYPFSNTSADDILNAGRMLIERITDGRQAETGKGIYDLQVENNDFDLIENYYGLVDKYKQLKLQIKELEQQGGQLQQLGTWDNTFNSKLTQLHDQLRDVRQSIQEYDQYFKGEGRTHDAIARTMYGYDVIPEEKRGEVEQNIARSFINRGTDLDKHGGVWQWAKDSWKNNKWNFLNILSDPIDWVFQAALYGSHQIGSEEFTKPGRNYVLAEALKNIHPRSAINTNVDQLYRGGIEMTDDGFEYNKYAKDLIPQIDKYREENNQRIKELTWQYTADERAKQLGLMKIPFTSIYTKMYDPWDISPEWRQAQQEHAGEFWHPLYMLPELGSSLGLMQGMVYSVGLNVVANRVVQALPAFIIGGGKFKSIKALRALAMSGGEEAAAAQRLLASLATKRAKAINYATAGIRSAEVTADIGISAWNRQMETAQEAMEGLVSRTMNDAFSNNADGRKVFDKIIDYCENVLHIDTSGMDPQSLIRAAITFDIDTGDEMFEAAKRESSKGLMKLINANNTLAFHDYLETMPFLSYGGNILGTFSKLGAKVGKNWVPIRPTKGWFQSPNKLWTDIRNNFDREINLRAMGGGSNSRIAMQYADAMGVAKNSIIDGVARKFFRWDMPKSGLFSKHIGDYAKAIAKRSIPIMITEGFEEGVQNVLQQRYQAGEYDGYNHPYSMFNVGEMLNNIELSKYTFEALFGMHGSGDDEIRKAFMIGAFISPLQGMMVNSITNLSSNRNYENLRNLIGQLRTDRALGNMVANGFTEKDDTQHLELFYEAFRRAGSDNVRLTNALTALKLGIDNENSLVTEDYIDKDIKHVQAAWVLYNNESFAKDAEKHGIKKYSPEYKNMIVSGARTIVDAADSYRDLLQSLKAVSGDFQTNLEAISILTDPESSEEDKQRVIERNPGIQHIHQSLQDYVSTLQSKIENWNRTTKKSRRERAERMSVEELMRLPDSDGMSLVGKYLANIDDARAGRPISSKVSGNLEADIAMLESDPELKSEVVDYVASKTDLPQITNQQFSHFLLDAYNKNLLLKQALGIQEEFRDAEAMLKKVRKLTGKDVDVYKIKGLIDNVDDLVEKYREQANNALKNINAIERQLQFDVDEDMRERITPTLDDLFSGSLNFRYENEDDILRNITQSVVNQAVYGAQSVLANAYYRSDRFTPSDIASAIFGAEGAKFSPYEDLIRQYYKAEEEWRGTDEMDRREGEDDVNKKLKKIREDAAWKYITNEAKNLERRKLIAHRRDIEEAVAEAREREEEEAGVSSEETAETPAEESSEVPVAPPVEESERPKEPVEESTPEETVEETEGESASEKPVAASEETEEPAAEPVEEPVLEEGEQEPQIFPKQDSEEAKEPSEESQAFNGSNIPQSVIDLMDAVFVDFSSSWHLEKGHGYITFQPTFFFIPRHTTYLLEDYVENLLGFGFSGPTADDIDLNQPIIRSVRVGVDEKTNIVTDVQIEIIDSENIIIRIDFQKPGVLIDNDDNTKDTENISNVDDINTADQELEDPEKLLGDQSDDVPPTDDVLPMHEDHVEDVEPIAEATEFDIQQKAEEELAAREAKEYIPEDVPSTVDIDLSTLTVVDDIWINNGQALSNDIVDSILASQFYLQMIDAGIPGVMENAPGRSNNRRMAETPDDVYRVPELLASTFFYNPDPRDKKTGEQIDDTMKLSVNGKQINLKYALQNGRELSKKLVTPGWFKNTNKYYIVTQSEEARKYFERHPEVEFSQERIADTFTVALILEDDNEKKCYACALRSLGKYSSEGQDVNRYTGEPIFSDGKPVMVEFSKDFESLRRKELSVAGIRFAGESLDEAYARIQARLSKMIQAYGEMRGRTYDAKTAKRIAEGTYSLKKATGESKEAFAQRTKQFFDAIEQLRQDARQQLALPGRRVLSRQQIDESIDKLRTNRNAIINAYLTKDENGKYTFPAEIRTNVRPNAEETSISNGRFNNARTTEGPALQNVTRGGNPFGLTSDVAVLSEQIANGSVQIGYGTGRVRANEPNFINDIRESVSAALFEKGGIAGKIFLSVKTVNDTLAPMMLIEKRFNTQQKSNGGVQYIGSYGDNLKLQIDPMTGEIVPGEYKPSAAELLLYMLFGKLSPKHIPGFRSTAKEAQIEFADFFIHNGEDTILSNRNVESRLPYYAAKQIMVKNGALIIGVQDNSNEERVEYHAKRFTELDLFDTTPEAEQNRIDVVRAIASQMHWNTERTTMNEKFGGDMTKRITKALEQYFENHPNESSYSIGGVEEFTFNKSDIFEIAPNGKPVAVIQNTNVAAWMLTTGKLLTDVGDTVFYAPFVYANGVDGASQFVEEAGEIGAVDNSGNVDVETLLNNQQIASQIRQQIGDAVYEKIVVGNAYETIVTNQDRKTNSTLYQKHGARVKTVVLTIDGGNIANENDFESAIIDKANRLVSELIKDKSFAKKLKDGAKINIIKLSENPIGQYQMRGDAYKTSKGIRGKKVFPTATVYEDGSVTIQFSKLDGVKSLAFTYVNGVFSSGAQEGIFDEDTARTWLQQKLGLSQDQIFVTNAVMRSMTNETVFGVTELAADTIRERTVGRIRLYRNGGFGLPFHEAWHYVNLLMHTEAERAILYRDFAKYNPEAKGKRYEEIEELMADDFKMWEEGQLDRKLSSRIKRFFENVVDFLAITRKKPLYKQVYKQIHKGNYNSGKLDEQSIKSFQKRYGGEVYSLRVPTVPEETTKNFKGIKSSDDFYNVGNALVDFAFQTFNLSTIEAVKDIMNNGFGTFRSSLKELADMQDNDTSTKILDFVNNPAALLHLLAGRFKDLGINVRMDAEYADAEYADAEKKEQSGENAFDRYQFSISKKQTAAFNVKLFMRQIPVARWVWDKNGVPTVITEQNDAVPGVDKLTPFDEAWNIITKNLGDCKSYAEIMLDRNGNPVVDEDGNVQYRNDSLRGMVKNFAKNIAFFYTLNQKLDDIEGDSQLKSQIFSTVNSQTPNMSSYKIQTTVRVERLVGKMDPETAQFYADSDPTFFAERSAQIQQALLAERNKEWILRNDNTLRAARNIPRQWSQRLLLQGLVNYVNDKTVIDKNYVTSIIAQRDAILEKIEKKNVDIEDVKTDVVSLLNRMGIIYDNESFDQFLQLDFINSADKVFSNKTILKHIKALIGKKSTGTIGGIIELMKNNVGKTAYENAISIDADGKPKHLDEAVQLDSTFVGTKLSSKITKLALAYHSVHPSTEEYGVRMPNGEMGYPNSQNNTVSTEFSLLNTDNGVRAKRKLLSSYAEHSIILNEAKNFDSSTPEEQKFKLNLNTGLSSDTSQEGADYFGITALEDYLINMMLLDQDPTYHTKNKKNKTVGNNEHTHLIMPTMADKKTHYDIQSKSLRIVHDCVLGYINDSVVNRYIEVGENRYMPDENLSAEDNIKLKQEHDAKLLQHLKDTNYIDVKSSRNIEFRRFSNDTLILFANYFLDEINSLIDYYNKDNIKELVNNPTKLIKNFHGKVKNGRMDLSGNGGFFRYFYDISGMVDDRVNFEDLEDGDKVPMANYNQIIEYLYNLQKKIESGEVKSVLGDDVGLSDIDNSLSLDNVDNTDGFELIRKWLDKRKESFFIDGEPSPYLLEIINRKLIANTEEELRKSTSSKRPLVVWDGAQGIYKPLAIPRQLLYRQNQRFVDKGKLGGNKEYLPYAKNTTQFQDSQMLFSVMANHVANTAISIIEFEKVLSGDPAFYKWQYIDERKYPEYATKSFVLNMQLPSGKVVKEKMSVKNLQEKDSDKTKRAGSLISPGGEIRTDYSDDEGSPEDLAYLRSNHYTNHVLQDYIAASDYIEEMAQRFKRQLFVDYIRVFKNEGVENLLQDRINKAGKNNYDLERFINDIYTNNHNTADLVEDIFKACGIYESFVEPNLEKQIAPFKTVNVSDAQVLVRPAMYRKIRKGLGLWSEETDEVAYNIIQKDGSWMDDPEKSKLVRKLELYPLKLAYFNNDSEQLSKESIINRPVLNKQAVFPLFKFQAVSEAGRDLYNRMNMEGNELDMLSFISAVKAGAPQLASAPFDLSGGQDVVTEITPLGKWITKQSDKHINYASDSVVPNTSDDTIPVTVQDIRFLRHQLNTESHEATARQLGTQVSKIIYQNLFDNALYGENSAYQSPKKGSKMRTDIIACINALTTHGENNVHNKLYRKIPDPKNDGKTILVPDDREVGKWVADTVKNQDLGVTAEEIISSGCVAECLSSRKLFESSAVAYINKHVIDIKTNGGTAVQQSIFGWYDYTRKNVGWNDGYRNYNNGEKLKWHTDNGTIEVMLSINFFKSIIPSDIMDLGYTKARQWLVDHDIIKGTKTSGEQSLMNPFGIAYRIPTQGLSSAFVMSVADVLPEQEGDVIVLPEEITSQTGSDYDVDKMYITTLHYEDGEVVRTEKLPDDATSLKKMQNFYATQSEKAIQNQLLIDYMDILQDPKNYANSRKSIDVIVSRLKNDFLNDIRPVQETYREGMYELLPSHQSDRKLEFKTGKEGIGTFAYNIVNITHTQTVGLTIDFGEENPYGFGALYEIQSKDGSYISDWLSAMVSAHVDVTKDPIIFDLNVNSVTYNHTAFLLRTGMGISTFSFLAQPILVEYATRIMQGGGLYGTIISGTETQNVESSKKRKMIRQNLSKEYYDAIQKLKSQLTEKDKKEHADEIVEIEKGLFRYKYDFAGYKEKIKLRKGKKAPEYIFDRTKIFNFEYAKEQIINLLPTNRSATVFDKIRAMFFNLNVLVAFGEIDKYANALSQLVTVSQIDTKKFGNTIQQQKNFYNKFNSVKYDTSIPWVIKGADPKFARVPSYALQQYFNKTFLDNKLQAATRLTREILSRQLLSATNPFNDLFDNIVKNINGELIYSVPKYERNKETGKWEPVFEKTAGGGVTPVMQDERTFKPYFDSKDVDAISNAINNVARFNIMINSIYTGNEETLALPEQIQKSEQFDEPIQFGYDGTLSGILSNVHRLFVGNDNQKSLPVRVNEFLSEIVLNPNSEKASGLVSKDKINNEFLLYLNPMPKTEKIPIDRLQLNESIIRTAEYKKEKLIADFNVLLTHENKEVRDLARDIAIYAYYASYDTPGRNQFFELVPIQFRSLYDKAITRAIRGGSGRLRTLLQLPNFGVYNKQSMSNDYLDIIAGNFYYNDKIVPKIIESKQNSFKYSRSSKFFEYKAAPWQVNAQTVFYGLIATTNVKSNSLFVKIVKGKNSVLYKRVGAISVYDVDKKTGKREKLDTVSVYMAVQKAGFHSGNVHMYEFYKNTLVPSIYDQNKLPKIFFHPGMWKTLERKINAKNELVASKKAATFYKLSIEEPQLDATDENKDAYYNAVYTDYDEDANRKKTNAFDHHVQVSLDKNPLKTINTRSHIIINLGKDTDSAGQQLSKSKTVNIDADAVKDGINVDKIVQNVQQYIKSEMGNANMSYKRKVSFNLNESLFEATQQEIDDFVTVSTNNEILRSKEDMTREQVDDAIKHYDAVYRHIAKDAVKFSKMVQFADVALKALTINGINIEHVLAAKLTTTSRAALTAAYWNRQFFANGEFSIVGMLYVNIDDDVRSSQYDDFMEMLDSDIEGIVRYDVGTEEDQVDAEELNDFVNAQEFAVEKEVKQKQQSLEEDMEEVGDDMFEGLNVDFDDNEDVSQTPPSSTFVTGSEETKDNTEC